MAQRQRFEDEDDFRPRARRDWQYEDEGRRGYGPERGDLGHGYAPRGRDDEDERRFEDEGGRGGLFGRGRADRGYGNDACQREMRGYRGQERERDPSASAAMQAEGPYRGHGPRGYARSDDRIRDDVCDRLSDDSMLDASEIDVAVKEGEVTLTGTVRQRSDRRRAEDLAEAASGVKHVQNNLRVKAMEAAGPEEGGSTASGGASRTARKH